MGENKIKKSSIITGIIAIALIIALVIFFLFPRGYRSVSLLESFGEVFFDRDGKSDIPVYEDMSLVPGDTMRTKEKSYSRLSLDSDKFVFVEEKSEVNFDFAGREGSSRTILNLSYGAVINEIEKSLLDDEVYEVKTPNALMAVRGTKFRVACYYDESGVLYTKIGVLEGKVRCDKVDAKGNIISGGVLTEVGKEAIIFYDEKIEVTDFVTFDEEGSPLFDGSGEIFRNIDLNEMPLQALNYFMEQISANGEDYYSGIELRKVEDTILNHSENSDNSNETGDTEETTDVPNVVETESSEITSNIETEAASTEAPSDVVNNDENDEPDEAENNDLPKEDTEIDTDEDVENTSEEDAENSSDEDVETIPEEEVEAAPEETPSYTPSVSPPVTPAPETPENSDTPENQDPSEEGRVEISGDNVTVADMINALSSPETKVVDYVLPTSNTLEMGGVTIGEGQTVNLSTPYGGECAATVMDGTLTVDKGILNAFSVSLFGGTLNLNEANTLQEGVGFQRYGSDGSTVNTINLTNTNLTNITGAYSYSGEIELNVNSTGNNTINNIKVESNTVVRLNANEGELTVLGNITSNFGGTDRNGSIILGEGVKVNVTTENNPDGELVINSIYFENQGSGTSAPSNDIVINLTDNSVEGLNGVIEAESGVLRFQSTGANSGYIYVEV